MNEQKSALQQQPEPVAPFWYAVVSDEAPTINKAIRRADVAEEYAQNCRENGYTRVQVVPLYTAPPALQQQEEPREVAVQQPQFFNEDVERMEATLPRKLAARVRAEMVASPSPQDFTLPMLEEGKGGDGVKLPRVGPEGWKRMAESQQALAGTDRRIKEISERYGLDGDGVPGTSGGEQP